MPITFHHNERKIHYAAQISGEIQAVLEPFVEKVVTKGMTSDDFIHIVNEAATNVVMDFKNPADN